jgi:hypothetical protein
MTLYYFVLALLPLSLMASLARSRDTGLLVLLVTAVTTIAISGLRWASDVDHLDYADMFAETPDLANFNQESIWDLHGEPGYLLASAILKSLGMDFVVLSVACAVFAVGAKAWVASRFSPSASLAFCLYLCIHFVTIEFIQIRWAVASALVALAVYHQLHRRMFATATLLALAISFHYFAAMFVLVCLLAEVRKGSLFYVAVVLASLLGLALVLEVPVVPEAFDSDVYVIKRTFRYLTDPLSDVGLLSYAKLAMFPLVYALLAKRYPVIAQDPVTCFLQRIAFASIAATLLISFVPLMHFRAVVLADFFALLLLVRMLDRRVELIERLVILSVFCALYAVWFVLDIGNYVAAGRLYEYRSWLRLFF